MNFYYAFLFFLLGSVLASFYGVVATRLPQNQSLIKPRSHCVKCHHVLSWYELIPIFSFLFLKGKCRKCHEKLSIYEPIMDFLLGLSFCMFYFFFGFSYSLWMSLILLSLVCLIFVSDFQYMLILDSPLVISSFLIFGLKWYYFGISEAWNALEDGVILFLIFLFIGYLGSLLFKREALGGGDIKLSFVMGLSLSTPYALMALILSTFLALPYATFSLCSTNEREVPFGPFLVAALAIVFFFQDKFAYILELFRF